MGSWVAITDSAVGCALARGVLPVVVAFLHLSLANRTQRGFERYLLIAMSFGLVALAQVATILVALEALAPAFQLLDPALSASAMLWLAFASDYRRLRRAGSDARAHGRAYLGLVGALLLLGMVAAVASLSATGDAVPGSVARHGGWARALNWAAALSAVWLCVAVARRGADMVSRPRVALFALGGAGLFAGHLMRNALGPHEGLTAVSLGIVAFLVLRQAHIDLNADRVRTAEKNATTTLRLHRISREMSKTADPAEICQVMLRGLIESLDADVGGVYLIDRETKALCPETVYEGDVVEDLSEEAEHLPAAKDPMLTQVARTGRPLYAFGMSGAQNDGFRCAVTMPLRSEENIIGVIRLANKKESRFFTEDDVRFMSLVVDHGGLDLANARLKSQEILHHRSVEQLRMARKIQNLLVPVSLPHVPGFECHATYKPALEVSGDYYDLYHLDESHVGVVVADVSGKGAGAALVMTDARTYMKTLAPNYLSPRACLIRLNEALREDLQRGMFITVLYAVLDIRRRTVRIARAGHTPAIIVRTAEHTCQLVQPKGPAVGLLPPERFSKAMQEEECELRPGDTLVLYTDGVTEAKNQQGRSFGREALCETLLRSLSRTPEGILGAVIETLDEHVGGATQYDDMTLVALKARKAPDRAERVEWGPRQQQEER